MGIKFKEGNLYSLSGQSDCLEVKRRQKGDAAEWCSGSGFEIDVEASSCYSQESVINEDLLRKISGSLDLAPEEG